MSGIDLHYKPKLREVDLFPAEIEGEQKLVLRDPSQVAEQALVLPQITAVLLPMMDGAHTIEAIQQDFFKRVGRQLDDEEILLFVNGLDRQGFLESVRFAERLDQLRSEYEAREIRLPVCAGSAYPEMKEEVLLFLQELLPATEAPSQDLPDGIISPHIDYARGKYVYRELWQGLAGSPAPDAVVILGTSHFDGEHLLSLSLKPYCTPLGVSPLAMDLVDALIEEVGEWVAEGSFSHWNEHSVELQVLLLQYLFGDVPIVSLLCGPLELFTQESKEDVEQTITRLQDWMQKARQQKKILCIAGADMSHVGTMFGDEGRLSEDFLQWLEQEDKASLELALAGTGIAFLEQVLQTQSQRKVCGLAPIFFLLKLLEPLRGNLVAYDQWLDEQKDNTVTFAAARLYHEAGVQ